VVLHYNALYKYTFTVLYFTVEVRCSKPLSIIYVSEFSQRGPGY